eukprot:gene16187-22349_t
MRLYPARLSVRISALGMENVSVASASAMKDGMAKIALANVLAPLSFQCHDGWYGHDCARKRASAPILPSESFDNMPAWLKDVVEIPPASADTPAASTQRKRPFIYVYDLPSMYNSRMLQYSNSG